MLTGDKVLADGETIADLRRDWPEAIGVEMESLGVALAAHQNDGVAFFMAKAVSDFADEQKDDEWHRYAAVAAASFAVALLAGADFFSKPRSVLEEDLLYGELDQRIRAVNKLVKNRQGNTVPLLVKGFDATGDFEVRGRIISALSELGTVEARDALRTLNPRYPIERDDIRSALESFGENNRDDMEMN